MVAIVPPMTQRCQRQSTLGCWIRIHVCRHVIVIKLSSYLQFVSQLERYSFERIQPSTTGDCHRSLTPWLTLNKPLSPLSPKRLIVLNLVALNQTVRAYMGSKISPSPFPVGGVLKLSTSLYSLRCRSWKFHLHASVRYSVQTRAHTRLTALPFCFVEGNMKGTQYSAHLRQGATAL